MFEMLFRYSFFLECTALTLRLLFLLPFAKYLSPVSQSFATYSLHYCVLCTIVSCDFHQCFLLKNRRSTLISYPVMLSQDLLKPSVLTCRLFFLHLLVEIVHMQRVNSGGKSHICAIKLTNEIPKKKTIQQKRVSSELTKIYKCRHLALNV